MNEDEMIYMCVCGIICLFMHAYIAHSCYLSAGKENTSEHHLHTLHTSFSFFTYASVTPKLVSSTTPSSSLFHHHSSPYNQTDSHHFYSYILTQFGSLIHQKTYHHLLPVALNINTRFLHHHFHIHLHKKPK